MHLCLSCRFVSPAGSLLCGRCGRSFGGRLCPRHHLSPTGSQFCVQCRRQDLTEATLHFPLGWLNRLLARGLVLLCIDAVSHHVVVLARLLYAMSVWGLHLLNVCPSILIRVGLRTLVWLAFLLLTSFLLPHSAGSRLRAFLLSAVRWSAQTAVHVIRGTLRWAYRHIEGAPTEERKKSKKKKGHTP